MVPDPRYTEMVGASYQDLRNDVLDSGQDRTALESSTITMTMMNVDILPEDEN